MYKALLLFGRITHSCIDYMHKNEMYTYHYISECCIKIKYYPIITGLFLKSIYYHWYFYLELVKIHLLPSYKL